MTLFRDRSRANVGMFYNIKIKKSKTKMSFNKKNVKSTCYKK